MNAIKTFLLAASRLLDLGCTLNEHHFRIKSDQEAWEEDKKAIALDWETIGIPVPINIPKEKKRGKNNAKRK